MKNKLFVLLFLISFSALGSSLHGAKPGSHNVFHYESVPCHYAKEPVLLQLALLSSGWSSKFCVYDFQQIYKADYVIFKMYNEDCSFFIRYNLKTHKCEVEFNARDESFDYTNFRKMMDYFFIPNDHEIVLIEGK